MPRVVLTFLALSSFLPQVLAGEPSFTGVGDLPGGITLSSASGVSGDGSVVCGYSGAATGDRAFRWTAAGGPQDLGDLPGGGNYSQARAISADGTTIVGDSGSTSGGQAFRWTAGGGMAGLGDLPGNAFFSIANGVNADGSVVVGHSESTASGTLSAEAFRWTSAGIAALGDLPGSNFFSVATAVSADGSKVGGYGTSVASGPASSEASRWTAASGMVGLGDLSGGGFGGNAFGISADGTMIVGLSAATGGVFAFRWVEGVGMASLGDLAGGSTFSRANGISADGTVVVGQSVGAAGMEAFIWREGIGMDSLRSVLVDQLGLDLTGWTLEVATAVSADGRTVVGYGPNLDGNYEGWVAYLGTGTFTDLGNGLAGTSGVPLLAGDGDLLGGDPVSFTLSSAAPAASTTLVVGLAQLLAPFKGGVLVPTPNLLISGLLTDASGGLNLAATWPGGLPPSLVLVFQMWIADAGGPAGYAASNGLLATTPDF